MTTFDPAAASLPNAASATQPSSQAARTARRTAFRDSFTRARTDRSAAEHDAAMERVIEQLQPLRRIPRGLA